MLSIILAATIAVIFTLLALQNTGPVTINFLGSLLTVPTYVVALGSLLVGIFVSLVFHLFDMFSANRNLITKDNQIRHISKSNQDLQQKVDHLATENAELQERLRQKAAEETSLRWHNFWSRVHDSLTPHHPVSN